MSQQNQPSHKNPMHEQQTHANANSQVVSKQVDTLFVGGGPGALGVLVNAVKNNRLNELLTGDGIAIIDAGLSFGGGLLVNYGINSNTSGVGFLKCTFKKVNSIAKDSKNKTKKLQDALTQKIEFSEKSKSKPNNAIDVPIQNPYAQGIVSSQKSAKDEVEIMPPFRDLYHSHITRVLKDFGKNTAPLPVIGHFLNYAGNHLLSYIYQINKKKIFYPLHKAVSIKLMLNGDIFTKVIKQTCEVTQDKNGQLIFNIQDTDQVVCFRSKNIVIGNGGVQGIHPELFNWFPYLTPEKVIASDSFLRAQGYITTMKMIRKQKMKKIVIIGGSHSGFSCAWMLLNGPSEFYNNNVGIKIDKVPQAQRKQIKNCIECCQCGVAAQHMKKLAKGQADLKNTNQFSPAGKPLKQTSSKCDCICRCFGFFEYDDWKFNYEKYLPDFEEASIEIIYRDHIRVFYNKVVDAEFDGYTEFQQEKFSKKNGYLYSFTGLRGDAKDLYLKITRGQEKRIKMVQAKSIAEQNIYVEQADFVIWACGYQTNKLTIKDVDRKKLDLSQKVPNTQFDVDGKNRIQLTDGQTLAKCFGIGIAYPIRTKDGMIVSNPQITNPRADSFSLYMNFVGENILKGILPKQKFFKNTIHKLIPPKKLLSEELLKTNYQQVLKERINKYRKGITNDIQTFDEQQKNKLSRVKEESHDDILPKKPKKVQKLNEDLNMLDSEQQYVVPSEFVLNNEQHQVIAESSKKIASKSVDRVNKQGTFQNKLFQMAKSPPILQKKQQAINLKNQQQMAPFQSAYIEAMLNQDIMPILQTNQQQKNKNSKLSNKKQPDYQNVKSPYKNNKQNGKIINRQDSQKGNPLGSRQGRELVRSSQGGRTFEQMNQQNLPGSFKMNRASQINFKKSKKQSQQVTNFSQNNNNGLVSNSLYNSIGTYLGQEKEQRRTQFPPILHPLNQNHNQEKFYETAEENSGDDRNDEDIKNHIEGSDEDNQYGQLSNQLIMTSTPANIRLINNQDQNERSAVEYNRHIQNTQINTKSRTYSFKQIEHEGQENQENILGQEAIVIGDSQLSDSDSNNSQNQYTKKIKVQSSKLDQNSGYDSHYEDENFEAEVDPFEDDVSSEGSCRNTNSYIRSRQDLNEQNEMSDDDFKNNHSIEIPDEEDERSPKRNPIEVYNKSTKNLKDQIRENSTTVKSIQSKSQLTQNTNAAQSNSTQKKQVEQTEQQKDQLSIKTYYKMGLDLKKVNKKQMSPILMNREQKEQHKSINNTSKAQQSARHSNEKLADLDALQSSPLKHKFVNESNQNSKVQSVIQNISSIASKEGKLKNAQMLASISLRQRQSKSIKQQINSMVAPQLDEQEQQLLAIKQQKIEKMLGPMKKTMTSNKHNMTNGVGKVGKQEEKNSDLFNNNIKKKAYQLV